MGLDDIVSITFSLTNPGVTSAGFGVPLIASPNATWVERTRTYSSLTAVAADWGAATPEYLAATKMFSQTTGLTSLMIGRCANKPTQTYSVSVAGTPTVNGVYKLRIAADNGSSVWTSQEVDYTAIASAAWTINTVYAQGAFVSNSGNLYVCITSGTSAGAGGPTTSAADITDNTVHWMYLGVGSTGVTTNDVIVYNLKLLLDGLIAPVLATANTLTGSVGSKKLQILANTAGAFFGIEALDLGYLSTEQTHADPGIAADLTALKNASSAWYGLITLHNSSALILAAAAWAEANEKLYIAGTVDSPVATTADSGATDIAHQLKAMSYARTAVFFHPANDEFAAAAEIARWFPIDPGGDDWRLKTLVGVTTKTYTDTQTTNLTAKYCNWYADLGGANVVQGEGKVAANEYIDVIRFRDWYTARLQERGVNTLIAAEKIPFTDGGIAVFETMIKALNKEGIRAGGIASDPEPVVVVPKAADIATADKQARWLRGVSTTWELAGAIHKLSVTVQATA
jgi:hypothetical protein